MRVLKVLLLAALPCFSTEAPEQALDRDWQITSLLNGSDLSNRNVFNVAFEEGQPSGTKRVWIAASNGLHSFDGYSWRHYGKPDGLPSDFVRSVLLSRSGQLWVGTDKGAGTFDGKTYASRGSEIGLAGQNVRRIVEDSDGTLWFCSDSWPNATGQGGLTSLRNGRWQTWRTDNGLPSNYVLNYFRDAIGERFALTLGGIAELHGSRWVPSPLAKLVPPGFRWGAAAMAESPQAGLIVSTGTDIFCRNKGAWRRAANKIRHEQGITATRDGHIIACGSTGPNTKAFMEWTGQSWKQVSAAFPVTHNYVEDIREAPDGSIYAVGFDCLQRWQRQGSEWTDFPRAPLPRLTDGQGRVWLMDQRTFRRETGGVWQDLGRPYQEILRAPDGSVWAWSEQALTHWRGNEKNSYGAHDAGIENFLTVNVDAQSRVWVFGRDGLGQQHLAVLENSRWTERKIPPSDWVTGAADPVFGMWYLAHTTGAPDTAALIHAGRQTEIHKIPPGKLSQFANYIHADKEGNVWLFGDTGVHRWSPKHGEQWETITHLQGPNVIACLERGGELWFVMDGTTGGSSGLANLARGQWTSYETDPLLSWSATDHQVLLFGSKSKFYVVPNESGSKPIPVSLPESSPVISILEDHEHFYWLGTSAGSIVFHSDKIPPKTRFLTLDKQVLKGEEFHAHVQGSEQFQPPGKSLNLSYSWRFDNADWSAFDSRGERNFSTRGMEVGAHRLEVRARDNGMDIDPTPATVQFQVHDLPIQERAWFLPVTACTGLLLIGLTAAAGSARRKLAGQARLLEQTVMTRTAELVTDIQRRKRVEQELRLSEERRRLATEAGGMGTWYWDISRGELISDEQCRTLFGYSAHEEVTHESFLGAIHPQDRERAGNEITGALQTGTDCDVEFRVLRPDRPVSWIRAKGRAEVNEAGASTRMIGIVIDVTELKLHQEKLEQANRVLQRSNDDLRQFAWAASHDLQEPLRMVVSYTQIIEKRYPDKLDEAGKQYVAFAVSGAKRMQTLLQALLEYWQVNERTNETPALVDAATALQEAMGNLEAAIAESGAVITQTGLPRLMVSETALIQLFQNLIANAIKYRKANASPRIYVSCERVRESEWRFSVQDNGVGIAPEHQKLVFALFKRLDAKKNGGAGIGLAICVKVVEHWGGKLWVESEPGRGSTFYFTIPIKRTAEWNSTPELNVRS